MLVTSSLQFCGTVWAAVCDTAAFLSFLCSSVSQLISPATENQF